MNWHLAQMNVAQTRWAKDHAEMADFQAQVDAIYQVADASPGFIWRLTEDSADPGMLVNISVWVSAEALKTFTYGSAHAGVFRNRARWFEKPTRPHQVLWWIPAGHQPGYPEGWAKLELLRDQGPTVAAFTFAAPFAAPD